MGYFDAAAEEKIIFLVNRFISEMIFQKIFFDTDL